ncbi:prephenate dehydrogenase/arogenate dehydrogenase family protein [Pelagibacteraceae bacterium]|nr:prephenate dehydrogenase/arogenate dehydrogenase family protein [Pelagibacteraceae bacterium]
MSNMNYESALVIGNGLIGSSIARALREKKISKKIFALDTDQGVINVTKKLDIVDEIKDNLNKYNEQFDIIFICSPLSSYKNIFNQLNNYINKKTLITDVGSTKISVIEDYKKTIDNKNILFVPAHPIAGLEKSGPEFGFAKLFESRYCILTPIEKSDELTTTISNIWESFGMIIEIMDPKRHDRVLAMTSHIPQLIAYSVVGTATELETEMKNEVIKYSAAGFRDFTRLAGSDPIMWRDVYQNNKEAVLEMLGRFSEDLLTFQKAIRNNDLQYLQDKFTKSKEIRKIIEDIGQAGSFDPTEKK